MTRAHILRVMILLGSLTVLAGCYPPYSTPPAEVQPTLTSAPSANCTACGTITAIKSVENAYQLTVRLDDGRLETITQTAQPTFRVGDRVQILNRPVPQPVTPPADQY